MTLRYGRKPAVHNLKTMRRALAMARALDTLGTAPAVSSDYVSAVKAPWGMFLNDQLGDCVCADTAHTLMLRTANASSIIVPQDSDVLALYEAVGGYNPGDSSTDQGCDENAMEEYLMKTGFMGHKAAGTAPIDPSNLDHIKWAVQLFGSCRLGLSMPKFAMSQFNAGVPWDVNPSGDQTIDGGHDVPIIYFDGQFFHVLTWGAIQLMTPAFFAQYCNEAHGTVWPDWIRAVGTAPSGFSLDQLLADLAVIETNQGVSS